MAYLISEHAKQRYSERIMDKTDKTEIMRSAVTNAEKIEEDINKMIEYGEELYTGKSVSEYNNNTVTVVLSGTWVVIVDKKANKVVTLYKIDLGLGEEFNKSYVNKLLDKFNEAKSKFDIVVEANAEQRDTYNELIAQNTDTIAEYKKVIASLEAQNTAYNEVIKDMHSQEDVARIDMRTVLGTMIGKKIF